MGWLEDLKSLGVAAGVPTASVFLSSKAVIPTGPGPYTSIISTGGTGADRTQNAAGDGYRRPSAQILSRASTYPLAVAQLQLFYDAITAVQNQLINGVWYVDIRPLQTEFIDLDPDNLGRARVAFNVLGNKR